MKDLLPLMASSPDFSPSKYLNIVQRDTSLKVFNKDFLKLRERLKKPNASKISVLKAHFSTFVEAQQNLTRLNRFLENTY